MKNKHSFLFFPPNFLRIIFSLEKIRIIYILFTYYFLLEQARSANLYVFGFREAKDLGTSRGIFPRAPPKHSQPRLHAKPQLFAVPGPRCLCKEHKIIVYY